MPKTNTRIFTHVLSILTFLQPLSYKSPSLTITCFVFSSFLITWIWERFFFTHCKISFINRIHIVFEVKSDGFYNYFWNNIRCFDSIVNLSLMSSLSFKAWSTDYKGIFKNKDKTSKFHKTNFFTCIYLSQIIKARYPCTFTISLREYHYVFLKSDFLKFVSFNVVDMHLSWSKHTFNGQKTIFDEKLLHEKTNFIMKIYFKWPSKLNIATCLNIDECHSRL